MCIGYHYLEYCLSGLVWRMLVSGLQTPGIITTQYMSNLLNGGAFGIEGGILKPP